MKWEKKYTNLSHMVYFTLKRAKVGMYMPISLYYIKELRKNTENANKYKPQVAVLRTRWRKSRSFHSLPLIFFDFLNHLNLFPIQK